MHPLTEAVVRDIVPILEAENWRVVDSSAEISFERVGPGEVLCGLNLNAGTFGRGVAFFPSIGVMQSQASELLIRLMGGMSSGSLIGRSLADLCPDRRAPLNRWFLRETEGAQTVIRFLYEDLQEFGMPFLASCSSLEGIVDGLRNEPPGTVRSATLAVVCAVIGRDGESIDALVDFLTLAKAGNGIFISDPYAFVQRYCANFNVDYESFLLKTR